MEEAVTDVLPAARLYFLVGFMGSGKSMLSKGLSQLMDLITIEMDDEIEKAAGYSINQIFDLEGEESFRKLEREVLHHLIHRYRDSEKVVLISTGGGVPCHFDNMEVMNEAGTTIFINPSVDRLTSRLKNKKRSRPLIKDKNASEIREYVRANLQKRMPFYSQAQLQINMLYDDRDVNIRFLQDIILAEELSYPR